VSQAATREEEIMTDFQFKALMAMVLEIAEKSDNLEEVKKALRRLASGQLDEKEDQNSTRKE
jgi:hypothetical protein